MLRQFPAPLRHIYVNYPSILGSVWTIHSKSCMMSHSVCLLFPLKTQTLIFNQNEIHTRCKKYPCECTKNCRASLYGLSYFNGVQWSKEYTGESRNRQWNIMYETQACANFYITLILQFTSRLKINRKLKRKTGTKRRVQKVLDVHFYRHYMKD